MQIDLAAYRSLPPDVRVQTILDCKDALWAEFPNESLIYKDVATSLDGATPHSEKESRVIIRSLKCGHEANYNPSGKSGSNQVYCPKCRKSQGLFTGSIYEKISTDFEFEYLYLSFNKRPSPQELADWVERDIRVIHEAIYRIQFAISLGISRIGETLPFSTSDLKEMAKSIGATNAKITDDEEVDLTQAIYAAKAEDVFRKISKGATTWAKTKLVFQLASLISANELSAFGSISPSTKVYANDIIRSFLAEHNLPHAESYFLPTSPNEVY